jgi:hypothetical protein
MIRRDTTTREDGHGGATRRPDVQSAVERPADTHGEARLLLAGRGAAA